jgi:hypothetical protein
MVGVFQAGGQADVEGLADPLGDAGPSHGNLASNLGDGFTGMIAPQNFGSLHLAPWRRLRTTQPFESLNFLWGQHQLCTPRFSCHAQKHTRKTGICEYVLEKRNTSQEANLLKENQSKKCSRFRSPILTDSTDAAQLDVVGHQRTDSSDSIVSDWSACFPIMRLPVPGSEL